MSTLDAVCTDVSLPSQLPTPACHLLMPLVCPQTVQSSPAMETPTIGLPLLSPAAPLRSLIQPALATASGSSPQAAAVAVEALAALSRLEAVRPGASRSLVGDMLAMLSVSSSPSLQVGGDRVLL